MISSREKTACSIFPSHELQATLQFHLTRGHKPPIINTVIEALLRLSQLLIDFPEIRELDINPLRLFQESNGCRALDARIMLRSLADIQPPVQ
jgi:succinyl-CoA synthetase beta subunit